MKKLLVAIVLFSIFASNSVSAQSVQYIEEKYIPKFEAIEAKAVTNLNQLIDEAYFEYEKKKENGEITLPLLFSYVEKGRMLEEDVDQAFRGLFTEMKDEIKQLGLPAHIADPIEKQYIKSKRQSKLKILKNITLEGHTISFDRKY